MPPLVRPLWTWAAYFLAKASRVVFGQACRRIGAAIIRVSGFDTRSALPLAEKCGVAFHLTNILRDIREDAERGRIYLPSEDLRRFGVSEDDLRAGRRSEAFLRLMGFEAERARVLRRIAPAARLDSPAQPRVVMGADRHLFAAAGGRWLGRGDVCKLFL